MDVVLDILDTFLFDRLYATILPASSTTYAGSLHNRHVNVYMHLEPSQWVDASALKRDDIFRQAISLFLITWIFGLAMYLTGSTIIYFTLFDRKTLLHPRHHPNQIRLEIQHALSSMPVMAVLTVPFFLTEIHGFSKLYDFTTEAPFTAYTYLQYPLFLLFTDAGIYWIHRGLHHRSVYGWLHKPHHRWIVPSPFASYAFHPIDGWSQSLPYHVFPLILPLQKGAYLGLFGFVTVWTLFIREFPSLDYL